MLILISCTVPHEDLDKSEKIALKDEIIAALENNTDCGDVRVAIVED